MCSGEDLQSIIHTFAQPLIQTPTNTMALDLAQLQAVLDSAAKAEAFKADVKRSLRKVSSLLVSLQGAVEEAESLMSDDYTPAKKERKPRAPKALGEAAEVDAEAPFGRKPDGTPKKKPGRAKAEAAAE